MRVAELKLFRVPPHPKGILDRILSGLNHPLPGPRFATRGVAFEPGARPPGVFKTMKRRDFTKAIAGIAAGVVAGTKAFADDKKAPAQKAKEHGCSGKDGCAGDKGKAAAAGDKAKHACQGLNACKGQGACKTGDAGCAGKNSCKGKGGCATAAKHDCKGKNECKAQGGCKEGDNKCAGKNSCKGKGGCKVPVKHESKAPAAPVKK